MPLQPCKLIKTVEEIQDQEDHPEQLDAAANQAMTQIAEQNDRRLVARDMRARRDDQRPDDHLFDVTEYFLGSLLDMLGAEPKPPASDIHGFSLGLRPASGGLAPVAWLKQRFSGFRYRAFQYREFQYTGSAIKPQESESPDFSRELRCDGGLPLQHMINKNGKESTNATRRPDCRPAVRVRSRVFPGAHRRATQCLHGRL